jgi:hypothetical protein
MRRNELLYAAAAVAKGLVTLALALAAGVLLAAAVVAVNDACAPEPPASADPYAPDMAPPLRFDLMQADPIRDRIVSLVARCHSNPDLFNSAVLGRPQLWWRQVEIANSIVNSRVTVAYTGNAIGKDYLVGCVVPWWLYTRANSLVIVTGPSQTLLGSVTWKEIRKAIDGARFPLGAHMSSGVKTSPQTVKLPGHDWGALGYSTTNVERASGQHNRKLLVIVEEASGVEYEVWEALDSLKFVRLFVIGNPIRAEGGFVDLIRQAEKDARDGVPPHRRVNAIRVPSTDSPHADLEESPYGLADRGWLATMERRYGKGSLWWRSHVDAEIPTVSSEKLIPVAWLDWSATAVRAMAPGDRRAGLRRIAIDLSEGVGRDSSAIVVRDDWGVLEVWSSNTGGLAETATMAARLRAKWDVPDERISFDKLGVGKEFPNHLARNGIRNAVGYSGEASPRSREWTNLRTEAAFNLRQRLNPTWIPQPTLAPTVTQPAFTIAPGAYWQRLRQSLEALTYDLVGNQTRLLPKKAWCEVLGYSPDVADALIQSFAFA